MLLTFCIASTELCSAQNVLHCAGFVQRAVYCAAGGDAQVCCSNNSRLINICALASISPLKSPLISRHCQNMNVITYKLNFTQKLFKLQRESPISLKEHYGEKFMYTY